MQKDNTEKYMREAIKQAKKAAAIGEVPIGCVIVRGGTILARGYNRRNIEGSTLAHAEIIAIKKASKKLQDWRLEDCELYVTLEPCPMCAGCDRAGQDSQSCDRCYESESRVRRKHFGLAAGKTLQSSSGQGYWSTARAMQSDDAEFFSGIAPAEKNAKRTILTGHTGIYIIKFVSFL